ncbi:GspE/PulE family protein [Niveibacterium umoris]|uniref:General secretion pathway protein E n=1 Tax=Niveibacterium umoris TaxID=1193620 RepID=A0A840BT42_9RHOO|nr:GspE/PulE family protein [Niveibacterium umoris]MBB4013527.1 general secretion pathway protein E [Niveibacterium umoris]
MNARPPLPLLTAASLRNARELAASRGQALLEVLAEQLALDARDTARCVAESLHLPYLDSDQLLAAVADWTTIPLSRALARGCVEVHLDGVAQVVIGDPYDTALLNWIEARYRQPVRFAVAAVADLRALLGAAEAAARALDSGAQQDGSGEHDTRGEELSLVSISEDGSPVVRLVNSTLYDALRAGASDIHFECGPAGMEVKYRIDGVLDVATRIAGRTLAEQAISRIKVLAELDIAERRLPQDGRFRVSTGGRTTDLRVSVMPSIHGEDAVLRILDKRQLVPEGQALTLDLLGFDTDSLARIRRLSALPYGMLLVTGPTGSGKTTTLYAAISETRTGREKIVTIEDPVEYELPGVLQIPVNEKKGLSFARGLRSILRHDPDTIMVGEIRDAETAEIAVQSALTGHLVLSTVHANNVFDVFSRFAHMGVDPHALVSALNGIWAQRLLRAVCRHCAVEYVPDEAERALLGFAPDAHRDHRFLRGRGCGDCRGTGYRGRHAIAEILTLTDPLREAILARESITTVKAAAARGGTRSLRDAALNLALRGDTTLQEVLRVTLQDSA